MHANELILMIHEYSKGGSSMNLSREGVRTLSDLFLWRPIETAPIDENVIFYVTSLGITEGALLPNKIRHAFVSGFGFRDKYKGATHWMPLPQPPAGAP